jgi:hypothetical protein
MLSGSISEQKSVFRPRTPCDPISRAGGAWSAPGRRRGRPQGPSPARWRSRHASGERRRKGRHLRDPRDLALRLAPSLPPPTEDLEPARGRGPGEGNEPAPGGEGAGRREGVPIKPPGIGVLNLAGLPRWPGVMRGSCQRIWEPEKALQTKRKPAFDSIGSIASGSTRIFSSKSEAGTPFWLDRRWPRGRDGLSGAADAGAAVAGAANGSGGVAPGALSQLLAVSVGGVESATRRAPGAQFRRGILHVRSFQVHGVRSLSSGHAGASPVSEISRSGLNQRRQRGRRWWLVTVGC